VLAVLRRRDFALLWLGGLVSIAGDWVLYAALPYYVYARTGSTIATAGMVVATLAPSVLVGSVAGVFVDRWDRKRVLVAANLVQAGVVALLLLVPHDGRLWLVYAVAAAQSVVASFSAPAEGALLPTLVGDADLVAANALNALNNRIGRLVGLPIGGAVFAAAGLQAVVVLDAVSFLLAAALVAPVAAPRVARAASDAATAWSAFWSEWGDGLRLVARDRTIALLFVVFGLGTFGGTMLDPLTPGWVRDVLDAGPTVFAGLMIVHAVTGIAGTLAVGHFGTHLTPRALIGWSSLVVGVATAVKYNVPSIPLALAMSAVAGVTSVASSIGVETLAQRSVRDEFRGRVFGSLNATLGLVSLTGALVGGALAEVVGIVPMLNVCVVLIVLSGLVALRALRLAGEVDERGAVGAVGLVPGDELVGAELLANGLAYGTGAPSVDDPHRR
jgi:MFS family permease